MHQVAVEPLKDDHTGEKFRRKVSSRAKIMDSSRFGISTQS